MAHWSTQRYAMQKLQPDPAQDKGNIDEKSVVREVPPLEASQNHTTASRKTEWQLRSPFLIAARILLLLAIVLGAQLLLQACGSQSSPGTASHQSPLPTPT